MAKRYGWFDAPLGAPARTLVTTPEEAVDFINQAFGQPEEYYYSAEQMRDIWRVMLTSGLIPEVRQTQGTSIVPEIQLGNCFSLEIGDGLAVSVNSGIGFIRGAYFISDSPEVMYIPEGVSDIVLRLDTSGAVVTYDLAVKPRSVANIQDNLSRSDYVYELGLHSFTVPTGAAQIAASMIIDQRLNMTPCADGNPVCGLVGSLLMPDIDAWYQRAQEILNDLIAGEIPPGTESISGGNKNLNPVASSVTYEGGTYNLTVDNFNYAALLGFANITFAAQSTSTGPASISINGGPALPVYLGASQAGAGDVVANIPYTITIDKAAGVAHLPEGPNKANKSKDVNATLSTAWTGSSAPFSQTVTVEGITAATKAILSPRSTVTKAQLEAFAAALMVVYSQGENTMTLRAFGDKPTVAIPVTVMILG